MVEAVELAVTAGALGEHADRYCPSAPARAAPSARPEGSAANRLSGICPATTQEPAHPAAEHLVLGPRMDRSRGEDRQQRAVEDADVVGREDHRSRCPGPAPGRARARRTACRSSRRAPGRSRRSMSVGGWATWALLGWLVVGHSRSSDARGERDDAVDDLVEGARVVSMWTAPSAMVSGAGPDRSRSCRAPGAWGGGEVGRALGGVARRGRRVGGEADLRPGARRHTDPMSRPSTTIPALGCLGGDDLALQREEPGPDLGDGADRLDPRHSPRRRDPTVTSTPSTRIEGPRAGRCRTAMSGSSQRFGRRGRVVDVDALAAATST